MSKDLIEKMAEAHWDNDGEFNGAPWRDLKKSTKELWREDMRAAISALVRELKQRDGEGWTAGDYIETRFLRSLVTP